MLQKNNRQIWTGRYRNFRKIYETKVLNKISVKISRLWAEIKGNHLDRNPEP